VSDVEVSTADITGKANLASPTFTGTPAAPTASSGTNTTQLATTAFVTAAIPSPVDISGKANISSPTFTGTPAAPTAGNGTNTTQIATTAFVTTAVAAGGGTPDLSQADVNIHGLTVGQGSGNGADNATSTTVGYQALQANTSGGYNVAVGYQSLYSNTTAYRNVGVGYQSLYSATTGRENVAVGHEALYSNTTGFEQVAIGYRALYSDPGNGYNVAVGTGAMLNNNGGQLNVAVGQRALYNNTTGSNNVVIGRKAAYQSTTGTKNVVVGYQAMDANSTGSANVCIGQQAGSNISTGSGNIVIGELNSSGTFSPMSTVGSNNNRIHLGHSSIGIAYVQVAWSIASDKRDKMNFAPVPHGLDFVNQLKPTAFQYKLDRNTETPNGNVRYGFIAQDILALEGDNPVVIDNEDANRLKYTGENLIPVLVNAVQELTAKVKHLEDEIKTLKG